VERGRDASRSRGRKAADRYRLKSWARPAGVDSRKLPTLSPRGFAPRSPFEAVSDPAENARGVSSARVAKILPAIGPTYARFRYGRPGNRVRVSKQRRRPRRFVFRWQARKPRKRIGGSPALVRRAGSFGGAIRPHISSRPMGDELPGQPPTDWKQGLSRRPRAPQKGSRPPHVVQPREAPRPQPRSVGPWNVGPLCRAVSQIEGRQRAIARRVVGSSILFQRKGAEKSNRGRRRTAPGFCRPFPFEGFGFSTAGGFVERDRPKGNACPFELSLSRPHSQDVEKPSGGDSCSCFCPRTARKHEKPAFPRKSRALARGARASPARAMEPLPRMV